MTKDDKTLYRELIEIAKAERWTPQRQKSMIGIFKSKTDRERRAMLETIKERRPKQ